MHSYVSKDIKSIIDRPIEVSHNKRELRAPHDEGLRATLVQPTCDSAQIPMDRQVQRAALDRIDYLHNARLIFWEGRHNLYSVGSTSIVIELRSDGRLRGEQPHTRFTNDPSRLSDHIYKRNANSFSQIGQEDMRRITGHNDEACAHLL